MDDFDIFIMQKLKKTETTTTSSSTTATTETISKFIAAQIEAAVRLQIEYMSSTSTSPTFRRQWLPTIRKRATTTTATTTTTTSTTTTSSMTTTLTTTTPGTASTEQASTMTQTTAASCLQDIAHQQSFLVAALLISLIILFLVLLLFILLHKCPIRKWRLNLFFRQAQNLSTREIGTSISFVTQPTYLHGGGNVDNTVCFHQPQDPPKRDIGTSISFITQPDNQQERDEENANVPEEDVACVNKKLRVTVNVKKN